MAVAFSPPAVAQEDYRCMFLQEDLLLCCFFCDCFKDLEHFSYLRNFATFLVDLIQETVHMELRFQ